MPKITDPEAERLVQTFSKDGLRTGEICKLLKLNGFTVNRATVNRIVKNKGKLRQAINAGLGKPKIKLAPVKRTAELTNKVALLLQQDNPPTKQAMAKMFGVCRNTILRILKEDLKIQTERKSKSHPAPADQSNEMEDEDDETNFDETPATPLTQFDDQPSKICLLCSSVCTEVKDEVISFFLEQLMCVSVEELQKKYVALNNSIIENLNLCGTCITFVKDVERIYAEWKIIKEKMKKIENQIKTKLQQRELSQDMFQENTTLFQLYEDIRNNLNSKKGEIPSSSATKNIASFYDLGIDIPEFISKNKKTRSKKFEETIQNEIDTEVQVKIENIEDPELNFGVIEPVTGMMASDDELESNSSSIHQRDDDVWVPSDGTLDNELSPSASAARNKSSLKRRTRKSEGWESTSSPKQQPIDEWIPLDNNMEEKSDSSEYDSSSRPSSTKKVKPPQKRKRRKTKSLCEPPRSKSRTGIEYDWQNATLLIKCTLCQGEYTDKSSVTEHFMSEHKTNCKFLRQEIIKDETGITYLSHYGADSSKPCKEKQKRPEPYPCPEVNCSKRFSTEMGLKLHLVHTHKHPKITSYDCELCDYKTRQKQRLQIHMMTHSGEKPELCSYCGVSYRRKETLADHIRTKHTLEKPFTCQFCKESFVCLDKMYRHMTKIHPEWSSSKVARKARGYSKSYKFMSEKNENNLEDSKCSSKSTIFNMDSQNMTLVESHTMDEQSTLNSNSNEVSQSDWSFLMS